MDDGSCDHSDARMIQAAFTTGAEACVLLLCSHPHLLHPLIVSLLRDAHHLSHDQILRIFSLAVFGHEPPQAVEHLRQLKPAGCCGHVFVDGELSYKCVLVRPTAVTCCCSNRNQPTGTRNQLSRAGATLNRCLRHLCCVRRLLPRR